MARSASGLRERLLDAALRLFVAHGYRGTSLHDIAHEVGCSKASLMYHFGCKEAILNELLAPAVADARALCARLAAAPDGDVVERAVTGLVGLALRYRREMGLLLSDYAEAGSVDEWSAGAPSVTEGLLAGLSGRSALPADRMRAYMVLGGVAVACAHGAEMPEAHVREQLTQDSLRLLGRERSMSDLAI